MAHDVDCAEVTMCCCCCCCRDKFVYLEEYPTNLLHELPERTGHNVTDSGLIVIILEYGDDLFGPGKDVFRLDRAVGEARRAHRSNFLHPLFYYYEKLPTGIRISRQDHPHLSLNLSNLNQKTYYPDDQYDMQPFLQL